VPFGHELTYSDHRLHWAGLDRPVNPGRRSVALSRKPAPTTTTLCGVSAMTPFCDVICYRPARDEAGEKCGYLVVRWPGGDRTSWLPQCRRRLKTDPVSALEN
jgi:hypothetical protein